MNTHFKYEHTLYKYEYTLNKYEHTLWKNTTLIIKVKNKGLKNRINILNNFESKRKYFSNIRFFLNVCSDWKIEWRIPRQAWAIRRYKSINFPSLETLFKDTKMNGRKKLSVVVTKCMRLAA